MLTAEAGEVSKIRFVREQRGGRLRAANISFGFLNKVLKIARGLDQRESGFVHSMAPKVVTEERKENVVGGSRRITGTNVNGYMWIVIY